MSKAGKKESSTNPALGLGVVVLLLATAAGSYWAGTQAKHDLDAALPSLAFSKADVPVIQAFGNTDPVVAKVDNRKIHRSEVLMELNNMTDGQADESAARELFPQFLDQYVNIVLLNLVPSLT